MSELKLNTLSDRLNYAIKITGVTQAELARQISIKPQVIHYLCSSKAKSSRFTFELAHALGVNTEWLATGNGVMLLKDDSEHVLLTSQKKLAVLSWEQLKEKIKYDKIDLSDHKDWVLVSNSVTQDGFALKLYDKSMWPRFDVNTLVVIDPHRTPKEGDFVICYLKEKDDLIFREISPTAHKLRPLNADMFKEIMLDKDDQICGVLVEARWQTF